MHWGTVVSGLRDWQAFRCSTSAACSLRLGGLGQWSPLCAMVKKTIYSPTQMYFRRLQRFVPSSGFEHGAWCSNPLKFVLIQPARRTRRIAWLADCQMCHPCVSLGERNGFARGGVYIASRAPKRHARSGSIDNGLDDNGFEDQTET